MHENDNWNRRNPASIRAFIRNRSLELARAEKAGSPLAGMTDRGVDLHPEEEAEVRAYAAKMKVDYDRLVEDVEAQFIVIGERTNTKLLPSLGKAGVIPRNELRMVLKTLIYARAGRPTTYNRGDATRGH